MTVATSQGYLHYPPPAIHFTPSTSTTVLSNPPQQQIVPLPSWFWPVLTTGSDLMFQTDPSIAAEVPDDGNGDFTEDSISPIVATELDIDTGRPSQLTELQFPDSSSPAPMDISPRPVHDDVFEDATANDVSTSGREPLEEGEILENNDTINGFRSQSRSHTHERARGSSTVMGAPWDVGGSTSHPSSATPAGYSSTGLGRGSVSIPIPIPTSTAGRQDSESGMPGPSVWPMSAFPNLNAPILGGASGGMPPFQNFLPVGEYTGWELPFLHGWVSGQQPVHTGSVPSGAPSSISVSGPQQSAQEQQQPAAVSVANVAMAAAMAAARAAARAGAGMVGAASAGLGAGIGAQIGVGNYSYIL